MSHLPFNFSMSSRPFDTAKIWGILRVAKEFCYGACVWKKWHFSVRKKKCVPESFTFSVRISDMVLLVLEHIMTTRNQWKIFFLVSS